MKETDLAEKVIAYLRDQNWEIYQEVQMHSYGRRADIVATRDRYLWVIECKQSLGFGAIQQACHWRCWAHKVSIATWGLGKRRCNDLAAEVCEWKGIGLIEASKTRTAVEETIVPHLYRVKDKIQTPLSHLRECLCEEHKTYAKAGNSKAHFFSPFKRTIQALERIVGENPGISLKAAIGKIDHHYASDSSAIGSIASLFIKNIPILNNIKSIRRDRDILLYLKNQDIK